MRKCLLCQQEAKEGLVLLTEYVCKHCEHELIYINVDNPLYILCIDKFREIKIV